jgi:DNA-binding response OmpR family regulator
MLNRRGQHVVNRNALHRINVPTVLIVEDNLALADAVAEVLRSIGYRTLIAHDGEAALSEMQRSMAEVVIVDLELPAIDGLEVARRLREAYGERVRLIANTAWPDNAETHSITAHAGFDDVLIKPTSIYQILKAMQQGGQPA